MTRTLMAIAILAPTLFLGCDSDSLQTQSLVSDNRSGLRSSDLQSEDARGEPDPSSGQSAAPFTITLQGSLPESGSGAASYELFVTGERADTYHYSLRPESTECVFDEKTRAASVTEPIQFSVGEQGSYILCVRAYSIDGEASEVYSHLWTLDLKKPDVSVLNVPVDASGQTRILLTVTSEKAGAYKYAFNNGEKSCEDEKYSGERPLSESIALDVAGDGVKRICVKSVDIFGVESEIFEKDWKFSSLVPVMELDGLPPAVTISNEMKVIFAAGSSIATYQYNLLQGASDCTSTVYGARLQIDTPITSNLGAPGLNTLCIRGQDSAGKSTGTFSYSWTFDLLRKGLVIDGLPESEDPLEKLSLKISGVNIQEYSYALIHSENETCGNVRYSDFRPVETAVSDGVSLGGYTLCLLAKSATGDISTPSRYSWSRIKMPQVAVEATSGMPPMLTNLSVFPGIKVGGLNTETYKFGLSSGNIDCAGVTLGSGTAVATPFTLDLGAAPADGEYTVCIAGIGHFGQPSPIKKYTFTLDKTPPSFDLVGEPTGFVKTNSVSIAVTSATAAQYSFVRKLGRVSCAAAPESSGRFPIATRLTDLAAEGEQTLCVWTFDAASNPSAPMAATWTVDSVKPIQDEIQQIDAAAGTVDLRITLENIEAAGASYRLYSQTAPDADILPCNPVAPATYSQGPFSITANRNFVRPETGQKTRVCTYVEDPAGNTSNIKFTDIVPASAP